MLNALDSDGDGLCETLEYIFGTSPFVQNRQPAVFHSDAVSVVLRDHEPAQNLSTFFAYSINLKDWSKYPERVSLSSDQSGVVAGFRRWDFAWDRGEEDCEFVRIQLISVHHKQFLQKVETDSERIVSIHMLGGLQAKAAYFMDCTYEGDLYAKAGVSYTVGREANSVYGETINGVQVRPKHQFSHPVDPYVVEGDPSSGVLPWINEAEPDPEGSGDHKIQAYNFRVCMTDDPDLKVDWVKPESFREIDHELARRWFNTDTDEYNAHLPNPKNRNLDDPDSILRKFDVMDARTPNGYLKTDTNNHGPVSTDFIGANYAWPEASYAQREVIFQEHVDYIMGHFWFMANDPSIPEVYRKGYARFGLPKDEFPETGHWPHQLYVREARRMVSDYVLTEKDTQHIRQPEDPVAMGSYAMDSHNCQRFVKDGCVYNEGDVQLLPKAPYGISYRSITPAKGECENLFVPVCLSASHIAFGSIRMEPVFMALGESAAIATDMLIDQKDAVQSIDYPALAKELESVGQILHFEEVADSE